MKKIFLFSLLLTGSLTTFAGNVGDDADVKLDVDYNLNLKDAAYEKWGPTNKKNQMGVIVRGGYVIGGTSPIPLPAEVRKINSFAPLGGATIGADFYRMFSKKWGAQIGIHVFYEGFKTSANVKGYHMSYEDGGSTVKGYFTGTNDTRTDMAGITVPITGTLRMSPRWNVSFGPFASLLFYKNFSGTVYDGYLRQDTPTGTRIPFEKDKEKGQQYDLTNNMRDFYWGLQVLFEWKALQHMNVFGGVDWAMSNIFTNHETITFSMYPIYAKFGVAWRY